MQKQRFDAQQVASRYQAFLAGFLTVAGLLIITPIFSIFYGDDPSRFRRPSDGDHHLPPLPSLHGYRPSRRNEEGRFRPGQG